jgi:GntR family transcriptional regulator, transcriptional repressor for pyruvate dehydrogenase complex
VTTKQPRSTIAAAAEQLRGLAMSADEGALLGGEEALVAKLGVSRATIRQAARLLEREGLLRVRRGINGGYFAARPDVGTIEATVSAYLDTVDMDPEDVTAVASALWVEVLRKAASQRSEAARAMAAEYRDRVLAIRPDASFDKVFKLEQESRTAIFDLIRGRYIELIFQINMAFAQRRYTTSSGADDAAAQRQFVHAWRNAKLMELEAIADGDPDLGALAARHMRNLWAQRIWSRIEPQA